EHVDGVRRQARLRVQGPRRQHRCDDAPAPLTAMWEERWHPLREEWVIVAAHRQSRPWAGAEIAGQTPRPAAFDPTCYLCPGNARVGGAVNPRYTGTFV